jgi:branched-chain amino acid transport system substrate-binding protein
VAALQKLINVVKVPATISLNSGVVVAQIPVAERSHSILFDIGSTSPEVEADAKHYTFSNYPKAEVEGAAEAKLAYQTLGARTAAALSVNVESGQGQITAIMADFTKLGGKIISNQTYPEGTTSFQTLLTKVKAAKPDVIFLAAETEGATLIKQARQLGITTQFVSFSDVVTQQFTDLAGSAANGLIATSVGWNPNDPAANVQNFIKNFTAKFKMPPIVYSATAYDAVNLIAAGIKANGYTADGIRVYLHTVKNYPGVSGSTTIEANGMPLKPVYFEIVKSGKWVPYQS